jgi:hypothetical protein
MNNFMNDMAKRRKEPKDRAKIARLTVQLPSDIKAALDVAVGRLGMKHGKPVTHGFVITQLVTENLAGDLAYVRETHIGETD